MNHGYCHNCWWWEPTQFDLRQARNIRGNCWMNRSRCDWNSYCPDYWNRRQAEKKQGTLQKWIAGLPNNILRPEDW